MDFELWTFEKIECTTAPSTHVVSVDPSPTSSSSGRSNLVPRSANSLIRSHGDVIDAIVTRVGDGEGQRRTSALVESCTSDSIHSPLCEGAPLTATVVDPNNIIKSDLDEFSSLHVEDIQLKPSSSPIEVIDLEAAPERRTTPSTPSLFDVEPFTFKCSECDIKATSAILRENHEVLHPQVGDQDGRKLPRPNSPSSHTSKPQLQGGPARYINKITKCKQCGVLVSGNDEMAHFEQHRRQKELHQSLKCTQCSASFEQQEMLDAHLHKKHATQKWTCNACARVFRSRTEMRIHLAGHVANKLFPCRRCDYIAKTELLLADHMEKQHLGRPFACPSCDFKGRSNVDLGYHISQAHKR